MPFHVFGPPHLLPIVLSSALAFAAGAYYVTRNGLPASVTRAGTKIKARLQSFRRSSDDDMSHASTFFTRGNSTGNHAFEEYRTATLNTLEQEAAEFRSYLDGLRHAKDKSEFDAFLSQKRGTSADETSSP